MPYVPSAGWFFACLWSGAAGLITWRQPLALVGIPAPVLFMAFAGAAAGLITQPPQASRKVMMLWVIANTFFGMVVAIVLGAVPKLEWIKDIAPALAGLIAFFGQALIPAARDRLQREVKDRGAPEAHEGGPP